ncbi:MAG: hypothetical protein V3S09_00550, partial [Candidatus Bathyarchaeia archaeon]
LRDQGAAQEAHPGGSREQRLTVEDFPHFSGIVEMINRADARFRDVLDEPYPEMREIDVR